MDQEYLVIGNRFRYNSEIGQSTVTGIAIHKQPFKIGVPREIQTGFWTHDYITCVANFDDKICVFYVNGQEVFAARMPKSFFDITGEPKKLIPIIGLTVCTLSFFLRFCFVC